MARLVEMIRLSRISTIPNSGFLSGNKEYMNYVREFLIGMVSKPDVPITKKDLMEIAKARSSVMAIYELGLGLPIIIPEDAETQEMTSLDEIALKTQWNVPDISGRRQKKPQGELIEFDLLFATRMARESLDKMLRADMGWSPIIFQANKKHLNIDINGYRIKNM